MAWQVVTMDYTEWNQALLTHSTLAESKPSLPAAHRSKLRHKASGRRSFRHRLPVLGMLQESLSNKKIS